MIVDIVIVILACAALYRGYHVGFVRQIFSTAGFFGGLYLGALLQPYAMQYVHGESSRSCFTLIITLGTALLFLLAGEEIGIRLKRRLQVWKINRLDISLGAVLNLGSMLLSIWLLGAIMNSLTMPSLQNAFQQSRIITSLNKALPSAPTVISNIGRLIDPNGFPQVFIGDEPTPQSSVSLPSLGSLQSAVDKDRASVVKIVGSGCGSVSDGSGFVVRHNVIATNAHVIAGIEQPYVQDATGRHKATIIWFDPKLDFALLRTDDVTAASLPLATTIASNNSTGAVLGYPGGGTFVAGPAVIMDNFTATGRNIYGLGSTKRDVYEVHATIIPGNSGGPLIDASGTVTGVVFAESTSYQNVGYALTAPSLNAVVNQAAKANLTHTSGRCIN